MKHSKGDTILHELRHHLPFTLGASLVAGVLVGLVFLFGFDGFILKGFEIAHPLHVLVSAAATSAIYYRYKKSFWGTMLVGIFGSILIGTISDVLLPWVAGNVLPLHTHLHLPIVEEPILILGVSIIGALAGFKFGMFKVNHSLHVFLSIFASMFYLLAFSVGIGVLEILLIVVIVFLAVYIPCCISDIVLPLAFIRKPCRSCGYWHE